MAQVHSLKFKGTKGYGTARGYATNRLCGTGCLLKHPYAMPSAFSVKCYSEPKYWAKLCSGCMLMLWPMMKCLA